MFTPRTVNPLDFITPVQIDHAVTVLRWLDEYISSPHSELGREGPICPFVAPAIARNSVYMAFHYEVTEDEDHIKNILDCYIPVFLDHTSSDDSARVYKTLVIVFPNIPANETTVLDRVHSRIKTDYVQSGLMLGQFHQHCPEPAARNPFFRVSISPIPLIAVRHMAVHDILFLADNETWFKEYDARFGSRYERKMITSELFIKTFNAAKNRFSNHYDERLALSG
jgi:hypothetical protein